MKTLKLWLVLVLAAAGAFATQSALAGGRVAVGIGIGVPVGGYYGGYGYGWGPHYGYGYPYYYSPYYAAPVVVQQQAPVYIEQQPAAQPAQPSGSWYYCNDSRAYYPYVKECPAGWQRVAPQPAQ
jgi:hypothetical protein